jgi:hypothetical protein
MRPQQSAAEISCRSSNASSPASFCFNEAAATSAAEIARHRSAFFQRPSARFNEAAATSAAEMRRWQATSGTGRLNEAAATGAAEIPCNEIHNEPDSPRFNEAAATSAAEKQPHPVGHCHRLRASMRPQQQCCGNVVDEADLSSHHLRASMRPQQQVLRRSHQPETPRSIRAIASMRPRRDRRGNSPVDGTHRTYIEVVSGARRQATTKHHKYLAQLIL